MCALLQDNFKAKATEEQNAANRQITQYKRQLDGVLKAHDNESKQNAQLNHSVQTLKDRLDKAQKMLNGTNAKFISAQKSRKQLQLSIKGYVAAAEATTI